MGVRKRLSERPRRSAHASHGVCPSTPARLRLAGDLGEITNEDLRFTPEEAARGPITIPAVFTDRGGDNRRPTARDSYLAGAYLAVERVRPELHACDRAVRINLRPVEASATIALSLNADGTVQNAHVDPWTGNKDLAECAAKALAKAKFDPPPEGKGSVTTRVVFNPRTAGAR